MSTTKQYVPQIPPSGVQLVATRTVRIKSTGGEALINVSDFDAALHEVPAPPAAPTADALEALTVAQLTELAIAKQVDLGTATRKADVIAALFAAGVTGP